MVGVVYSLFAEQTREQLPQLHRNYSRLTWSESSVTRSPSLVIPSSFSSFRCGQSAKQKAFATFSVSLLWSAGSLRPLCCSSFSRKNTWRKELTQDTTLGFTRQKGYWKEYSAVPAIPECRVWVDRQLRLTDSPLSIEWPFRWPCTLSHEISSRLLLTPLICHQ